MKGWVFFLAVGVLTAASGEETKAPQSPPIIRAADLFSAYEENEIAADLRYKGKNLIIDGGVSDIQREDGVALIKLVSATAYRWEKDRLAMSCEGADRGNFRRPVFCLFDKEWEGQIAGVSRNQHVQVAGICAGKIVVGQTTFGAPDELGKSIWKVAVIRCKVFERFVPVVVPQRQPSEFHIERGSEPPAGVFILDSTVYVIRGTHLFHRENCRRIDWRRYRADSMYRSEAVRRGCLPCAFCNP
jgi:hypothetical protein